jgi:hypothetical protein
MTLQGSDGSPACESAVVAAIGLAEKILRMIDSEFPSRNRIDLSRVIHFT